MHSERYDEKPKLSWLLNDTDLGVPTTKPSCKAIYTLVSQETGIIHDPGNLFGYPSAYTEDGALVELGPDAGEEPHEDAEDVVFPLVLLRSRREITGMHFKVLNIIWWHQEKQWLLKLETQGISVPEHQRQSYDHIRKALQEIEAEYGQSNLEMSDFDLGIATGVMAALEWVRGAEWENAFEL